LLVLQTEKSTLAVGWLFVAVAVPQVLLSALFGRLADHFDRRALCILCDLLSCAVAVVFLISLHFQAKPGVAVYLANLLLAAITAMFLPASTALIKERVQHERLGQFNANFEIATQAGTLLSTAIGGAVVQLIGTTPLFAFNAATFVVSAACLLSIGRRSIKGAAESVNRVHTSAILTTPAPIIRLGLLYALGNVVITVSNTLIVVLVIRVFHQGAGVLGVIDSLAGIGVLIAAAVYKSVSTRVGNLRIALVGYLGCAVFIALEPQLGVVALMFLLLSGALTFGLARVAARTLLMSAVVEDRVGRVFGATNAFGLAFSVVATLAISGVADHTEVRYGFLALALLVGAISLVAAATLWRTQQSRQSASLKAREQPNLLDSTT
jgi:MFS family permease